MRIISKSAWREVVAADSTVEGPVSEWYKVAKSAEWHSLADVKTVYRNADFVDPYTIFNFKGNHYRLIVKIEYRWQIIFVRGLLRHSEYTRVKWKS